MSRTPPPVGTPLVIPRNPPRDVTAIGMKDAVGFMLRVKVFVAWFFIITNGFNLPMATLLVATGIGSDKPLHGPLLFFVFSLVQLVAAWWWRGRLKASRKRRENALTHGVWVNGVVTAVTRWPGLSLAMARMDYRFTVDYVAPDGTQQQAFFVSPLGLMRASLEKGSAIQGLVDPDSGRVVFPAEMGVHAVSA